MILRHKFVEHIPDAMEYGVLYVSVTYCTAMHLCACGCGNEVVTPISPTGWQLKFDGKAISLSPSIGNWSFKCRSHYWIVKNEVRYAKKWDDDEIADGRLNERKRKDEYFHEEFGVSEKTATKKQKKKKQSIVGRFKSFFNF